MPEQFSNVFELTCKLASKALDLVRWQGVMRLEPGAYTSVREHFQLHHNAANGQEMKLWEPV